MIHAMIGGLVTALRASSVLVTQLHRYLNNMIVTQKTFRIIDDLQDQRSLSHCLALELLPKMREAPTYPMSLALGA